MLNLLEKASLIKELDKRLKEAENYSQKVDVNPQLLQRTSDTNVAPLDENYNRYLVCVYKLGGFYDENTLKLVPDKLLKFYTQYFYQDEVNYIMSQCGNVQTDCEKETMYSFVKCVLDKFKDIDIVPQKFPSRENDENQEVNSTNGNATELVSLEEIFNYCQEVARVNPRRFQLSMESGVPPINEEYRECMLCVYKKQGYFNGNTSTLHKIEKTLAELFDDQEEVDYIMQGCKNIHRGSDRETVSAMRMCLRYKMRDIFIVQKKYEYDNNEQNNRVQE